MSFALEYFMWPYQPHFQISVENAAERLVALLNKEIKVEAFLVGVCAPAPDVRHPVCLEPEECGFKPSDFETVLDDAEHFHALDPDAGMMTTHPVVQANMDLRVRKRAFTEAVLKAVTDFHQDRYIGFYVSSPQTVGGYEVVTVLKIEFPEDGIPYRLPKVHSEKRYGSAVSLFDAAINLFLIECSRALYAPKPESVEDIGPISRPEELMYQAGRRLMNTLVWATHNIDGMDCLFRACEEISALRYEGGETRSGMIIARENHPNLEIDLSLESPIDVQQHRSVRKLLEIAKADQKLLCDGRWIFGLGHVKGNYNQGDSDLFEIQFRSHHSWRLVHSGHLLMKVEYGLPKLVDASLNQRRFVDDISRIFPHDINVNASLLSKITRNASEAGHGTVIVVHPLAGQEAARLKAQSTLIKPRELKPEEVAALTAIDGAVLLNPAGTCYAIGVILDGMATTEGDSSRGSRFNSSLRYVASQMERGTACLAVVISEDGDIGWLPELRPRLFRQELKEKVSDLDSVLEKKDTSSRLCFKTFNWMQKHAFYLNAEICAKVNELGTRMKARAKTEGALWFDRPSLAPNPEMDDTFLTDQRSRF